LSETVRLAVARDEAFSFYYKENMELLEQMGAELVPFSPLHDSALPEDIDGLLLGGGYPENNTKELSEAVSMRMEIKKALEQNLPCLAECGGFLYLQETLEGSDGIRREMTGVLQGEGFRTKKLSRFGYIELENQTSGVFGTKGQSIRGHEFHYWDCTENGTGFQAKKPMSKICYPCMIHNNTMAAGFPHLYYYSNPQMIWQFLLQCQRYHIGRQAKRHWDQIAKPIDSLGLLEEAVVRICKISGSAKPYDLSRKALVILCADHGVVAEGVTQTDSSVTQVVSENFAKGCSTVNYMANLAKTDVYTVDVGMNTPPYPEKELKQHTVIDRKIARGTNNLAREAAMSLTQCQQALEIGKQLVRDLKQKGYQLIATGEMGIGNTTPSSALSAVFLNQTAGAVTGKGAGLSSEGMVKKQQAISQAMERVREKELSDPKAILAEIGGYEIAAMAGVFLGGMEENIPIVLDGAISEAAALTAARIDSRVTDFMIASHESKESIGKLILKELQLKAVLHADMCLGEGTGAMAMMPILDMAMEVYEKMGTFGEYQIDAYHRFEEEE
jgi:cobyrinic acid a,c-diamide synthase